MKRQRTEAPSPTSEQAARDAISDLASWCDDTLKEVAEKFTHDPDVTASVTSPLHEFAEFMDGEFDEFLETLATYHNLSIGESNKGVVAKTWRECATDCTRMFLLRDQLEYGSSIMTQFVHSERAENARADISSLTDETFDRFNFDMGWKLAEMILGVAIEPDWSGSDDDNEPVEESDSEDSEEDDSDSSKASSSDSSDSGDES